MTGEGRFSLEEMDFHLVTIETGGSPVISDWKVEQSRASAREVFSGGARLGRWSVSLDDLTFYKDGLTCKYDFADASSGTVRVDFESLQEPHFLCNFETDSYVAGSLHLIGGPLLKHDGSAYFFFSKKKDPLKAQKVDFYSAELGDMQGGVFLKEVTPLHSSSMQVAPKGARWIDWLGLSFVSFFVIVILTCNLIPWRLGYGFVVVSIACIFASIALDRWRVDYASAVAADKSKMPATRYLAVKELNSSFFWRHRAEAGAAAAHTEDFDSTIFKSGSRIYGSPPSEFTTQTSTGHW